jgi:hypothetical protein
VRAGYERVDTLDEVLRRLRELSAQTAVFDIEPLIAFRDSRQEALDGGVAPVVSRAARVPSLQVLCFATNSPRQPSVVPGTDGMRVIYLASAGKPMRLASYRDFPRPGVVGDQVATDGILARRLDYAFAQYLPRREVVPAGPRLKGRLGWLVRPVIFRRPG